VSNKAWFSAFVTFVIIIALFIAAGQAFGATSGGYGLPENKMRAWTQAQIPGHWTSWRIDVDCYSNGAAAWGWDCYSAVRRPRTGPVVKRRYAFIECFEPARKSCRILSAR